MRPLSQSEYGEIKDLYKSVYAPKFESILDEFTDEDLDDLTEEYIEDQVNEFFQECIEEGLDVDIIEETICESIDSSLELLSEVTSPAKVAAARMRSKQAAADGEGSGDAGAKARAKLNVSRQKVGGSSEKKASKLSMVKGAVKKAASAGKAGLKAAGKAAQGGVGLAARAVGTAQRAGSAVKSAAKSGYERGKQGSGGGSSSTSSTSGSSSSSTSGSSSSGSSSGSSPAPRRRKDGLLKRGLKKLVRGVSKGVSAAAGAVKAGADSLSDRARKEEFDLKQVDEGLTGARATRARQMQDTEVKRGGGKRTPADRDTAFRLGTGTGPGRVSDRPIKSQSDQGKGNAAKRRMKMEELEATGLFSEKEIEAIMEADSLAAMQARREKRLAAQRKREGTTASGRDFGRDDSLSAAQQKVRRDAEYKAGMKKEEVEVDEAMSSYDRNRKRAAERAAARNAARDAGKTGVVPGVGYVTPRRERETYTDEKGTVRHKSGAKMPKD